MNVKKFLNYILFLVLIGLFLGVFRFSVYQVKAATRMDSVQITPAIIDLKFKKGEFSKEKIVIENLSGQTMFLYPFVYYVDSQGKRILVDEAKVDRSVSLAKWLNFPRGAVEFYKGKEQRKEIEILISPSPYTPPGIYHAVIAFAEGGDQREAKDNLKNAKTVMINVEFIKKVIERLQIKKFTADKLFVVGQKVGFEYQIENSGNNEVVPDGEIRIYDRRGAEVTTLPVNQAKAGIAPSDVKQLASVWEVVKNLGRYKATLNLYYGEHDQVNIQDTIFLWILPWPYIVGLVLIFIIFTIILVKILHHSVQSKEKVQPQAGRRIKVLDIKNHHDSG